MGGEAMMREVAEAVSVADLRPLFEAIDDDIIWRSGSTIAGALPFGGVYRGRRGVVQIMSELAHAYSFICLNAKEIVSRGAIVWGVFEVRGERLLAGGNTLATRPFVYESAFRWRLRRGRVVEHQGFFDTNALIRQTR